MTASDNEPWFTRYVAQPAQRLMPALKYVATLLLGAAITLLATFASNQQNQEAELKRQNVQFLQSQRLSAYNSFVTASEDLLRAERNASRIFIDGQKPPTRAGGQSRIDTIGDLNVKLQTAGAEVEMLANPQVTGQAKTVVSEMEHLSNVFFDAFDRFDKLNASDLKGIQKDANDQFAAYYRAKQNFLDAIKPDFPSSKG